MEGPKGEGADEAIAAINIIPLVDVVLVLLIIFMVTTAFSKESKLKVNLPKSGTPSTDSNKPAEIMVNIDKTGIITIQNQPTEIKDVQNRINSLLNKNRETLLVLRGDRDAVYGKIIPLLDEISQTGVKITLAYLPKAGE